MRLTPRKRLVVDPKVQGALVVRIIAYWCFYVLTIVEVLLGWNMLKAPQGSFFSYFRFDQLWQDHAPVLVASLVMLPIMALDVLYISNRFVGPVYRARRSLRALAAGEYVTPLAFRKHDFCLELADEVNAVAAHIEGLKQQIAVQHSADQSPSANGQGHVALATRENA